MRFQVSRCRYLRPIKAISLSGTTSLRRGFSNGARLQLRSSELTQTQLKSLQVNSDRLWDTIHSTAQWGTGRTYGSRSEETGLSRLTLGNDDKTVRDWFVKTTEALSCKTYVDAIGNIFAIRPGLRDDIPATFAGSHLDSQPTGGRFDGILGVAAGIEMLRVLEDNWIETEGPVGVINWTNEEGARFPISMMGSGVWAGALDLKKTYGVKEVGAKGNAKTVKEELDRIGYRGALPAHYKTGVKLGAHFELHIEQGPYLVGSGEQAGAVEGVQSYKWFTINVSGRDCHTGTTGFGDRADALYWASKIIWEVRDIAEKLGGLASVGIIHAYPGSVNTVPGLVSMSLDIRHPEDEQVDLLEKKIFELFGRISEESRSRGRVSGVQIEMKEDFVSRATKFDKQAVDCVAESASSVLNVDKQKIRRMTSGAGHDSVFASRHCPTAMIFVPCRDGVSHHPEEWCEKEDCAAGASVLTQSVLRYDQLRHKNGEFD